MSRLTLLQRLKPEIKSALEANETKYISSVESIFSKLNTETFYSDLKISEVTSIYTFADINLVTLNSLELNAKTVKDDLRIVNTQLENVNKIKITRDTVNDIRQAIEDVFSNSSFNEVDSYNVDFEIDYNNSLALGSIEFNDADNVAEEISDAIENLFNVISDEDED